MQVRVMIAMGSAARTIPYASARLILAVAAMAALATTALSALGVLPWFSLLASFGGHVRLEAGMVAQIGVTTLLYLFVLIVPSNSRMRALEQSHRDFHVTTTDVANAYHAAHAADRTSVFTLSSEFNQMREDLEYLRRHPSLRLLEADMLRLANPPAASVRAIIRAVHSEREAGKVGVDADQARKDDVGHAHPNHDAEHTSRPISA